MRLRGRGMSGGLREAGLEEEGGRGGGALARWNEVEWT